MSTAVFTLLASIHGVHPASSQRAGTAGSVPDIEQWIRIAQESERAGLEAIFLADAPVAGPEGSPTNAFEPVTLLSALARETQFIGLIGTASTSFNEPYNVARQFASLQLISGGRAGWNSVGTSHPGAAENFGDTRWTDHGRRYRKGDEFTRVVRQLWNAGPEPIRHRGEFFSVEGPLNVPTSAGTSPLITQAGGSADGIRLAGRYADLTFAILADHDVARAYTERIRAAELAAGRPAGSVRTLPGVVPYLAGSAEEAQAYKDSLDRAIDLDPIIPVVARYLHLDSDILRSLPLDEPFPLEILPLPEQVDNSVATFTSLRSVLVASRPTTRQALIKASGGNRHREFVGTPLEFVVDATRWISTGAADGFTLLLPQTDRDLGFFADRVTPLLRMAGLVPETYRSPRLRDRLQDANGVGVESP